MPGKPFLVLYLEPLQHSHVQGREKTSESDMHRKTHVIVLGQIVDVLVNFFVGLGVSWITWMAKTYGKCEDDFAGLMKLFHKETIRP
jgi:hypothetical protein